VEHVNSPETEAELGAIRRGVNLGSPLGDETRATIATKTLGLEITARPQGRPNINGNSSLTHSRFAPFRFARSWDHLTSLKPLIKPAVDEAHVGYGPKSETHDSYLANQKDTELRLQSTFQSHRNSGPQLQVADVDQQSDRQ